MDISKIYCLEFINGFGNGLGIAFFNDRAAALAILDEFRSKAEAARDYKNPLAYVLRFDDDMGTTHQVVCACVAVAKVYVPKTLHELTLDYGEQIEKLKHGTMGFGSPE